MSKANPLLILGLNTTVLGGLSQKDIRTLIRSQYRVLSTIYHPDKGGNEAVFAMIAEAYESLQDDRFLASSLEHYLASRADQLHIIQDSLVAVEKQHISETIGFNKEYASFIESLVLAQTNDEARPLNLQDVQLVVVQSYEEKDKTEVLTQASKEYSIVSRIGGVVSLAMLKLDDISPFEQPNSELPFKKLFFTQNQSSSLVDTNGFFYLETKLVEASSKNQQNIARAIDKCEKRIEVIQSKITRLEKRLKELEHEIGEVFDQIDQDGTLSEVEHSARAKSDPRYCSLEDKSLVTQKQIDELKKQQSELMNIKLPELHGKYDNAGQIPEEKSQSQLYNYIRGKSAVTNFVLLGTIPRESIESDQFETYGDMENKLVLGAAGNTKLRQIVGPSYSFDEFRELLRMLKPSFNLEDYLVAAQIKNNKLSFKILGKIEPLEEV